MQVTQGIAIGVVLVAVGASVWYFTQNNLTNRDQAMEMTDETTNTSPDEAGRMSESGSIMDLLDRGERVTCEYMTEEDGVEYSGRIYIDGATERYSMTGQYVSEGEMVEFGALLNADTMYWWGSSEGEVRGMQMARTDVLDTSVAGEDTIAQQGGVRIDQHVSYSCSQWTVDESVFTPPSHVSFTDMGALHDDMMQRMPAEMRGTSDDLISQ